MTVFVWKDLDEAGRQASLARPEGRVSPALVARVRDIFDTIETGGFAVLREWAIRLDGHAPVRVDLSPTAITSARSQLDKDDLKAIELASANIRSFHEAEFPISPPPVSPIEGLSLYRHYRPVTTAGIYVPGGTAPLFSTLLMTALPAQIAGVPNRIAITPPAKDGSLHPMMMLAASLSGLETLWALGGAHGIAALALGLLEAPRADKLFGPGNAYVAEAKRQALERVKGLGIDMPAGPSELMLIADNSANPDWIAADLLSQAEHDAEAQVVLVSLNADLIPKVMAALESQVQTLPRADLARASLAHARVFLAETIHEAAAIANAYGPEHLSLQISDSHALIPNLTAAGTVFDGAYAAETFGDYASGPSHVLPTDGAARAYDGITVRSFMTSFVVQSATQAAATRLAPASARLARLEGLEAHARAADIRREAGQ